MSKKQKNCDKLVSELALKSIIMFLSKHLKKSYIERTHLVL